MAQHQIELRRHTEGGFIGFGAHVHVVLHVVFHHAVHPEGAGEAVLVFQGHGVSHRKIRPLAHLLGDDHTGLGEGHRIAALALMQIHKAADAAALLGHEQIGLEGDVAEFILALFLVHQGPIGYQLGIPQHLFQLAALKFLRVPHAHGEVVGEHLAELLVHDVADGIVQAEAGYQQGGAARDAHHRHEEPLFVAEQVAGGDLVGELHPLPHRPHPLQQDALARLGGLGQHQGGGGLHQGGPAGVQGGRQGTQDGRARSDGRVVHVKQAVYLRQSIHHGVGIPDDGGEQIEAHQQAEHAACHGGGHGVDHILCHDGFFAVAQRLHGADLQPFLLHHAGHGGQGHQRRHQEEEHREYPGDGLHLLHVGFQ